jgi:hypothetical protein
MKKNNLWERANMMLVKRKQTISDAKKTILIP